MQATRTVRISNLFTDGSVLDKLLFQLISPVERVLLKLLHIVHLLLDGSHRIERRQRHSATVINSTCCSSALCQNTPTSSSQ